MTDSGCRPGPSPRLGACPHLAPSAPQLPGGTVGTCAGRSLLCGQGPVCPSSLRHARLLLSLVFTTLLAGGCLRFYEVAPPYTRWLGCCWAALWGLRPGKACEPWDCEEKAKGPSQGWGPSHSRGGGAGEVQRLSPVLGGPVSPVLRRTAQAAPTPSLWRPAGLRRGRPTQRRSLAMRGLF